MVFWSGSTKRRVRRRGGSAAELALTMPLLLFALIFAIDFCRVFFHYTTITNAARNGALWASDPLANGTVTPSASPYATVQAAALADAKNLNYPALTASNVTSSNGTDSNGDTTVSVTVQYPFHLVAGAGSTLGISSINISRTITMRVVPLTPN